MNYLDVKNIGRDIEKHFEKYQRTFETHLGITNDSVLAMSTMVFGQEDLAEIASICLRHNVVILSWSAHYPGLHCQAMIITLSLSQVQKNGHATTWGGHPRRIQ